MSFVHAKVYLANTVKSYMNDYTTLGTINKVAFVKIS